VCHFLFTNRYLCNLPDVLLMLLMCVEFILLCLICIFKVMFTVKGGLRGRVVKGQWGGGGGELSRAV
jgi:hypothetical protein